VTERPVYPVAVPAVSDQGSAREKLAERLRAICSELKATFSITVGAPMTVSVTVDSQPGW